MKATMYSPSGDLSSEMDPPIQISEPRTVSAEDLRSLAFFSGIPKADLERIAEHARWRQFERGQTIVCQGDMANCFYVILSGRVQVDCNLPDVRLPVEEIGPGDTVGFSWLFTPDKLHFSARVVEDVNGIFIYGASMRAAFERSRDLGYELAKRTGLVMLKRLEAVLEMIGGSPRVPAG